MHDIARAAAEAAEPADFASIARRGRARRARGHTLALGAVAASVAVVVGLTQAVGGDGVRAPRPGPADHSRTVSDGTPALTPEARLDAAGLDDIVDAKGAQVQGLAVAPEDPDRMATIWRRTEDREVLALTDDGFATRTLLEVPVGSEVHALPDGRFVLVDGWQADRIRILDPAGSSVTVRMSPDEAPLEPGEIAVDVDAPGQLRVVAVAADGTAHPVPTPDNMVVVQSFGGRLTGIAFDRRASYLWSDDGGETWDRHDLGIDSVFAVPVRSAAGQDHAVVEGADGATLFPLVALHAASAGDPAAWTRTTFPRGGLHWTLDGGWVEDGEGVRLLLTGSPIGQGGTPRSGVFRASEGTLVEVEGLDGLRRDTGLRHLYTEYVEGPVVWVAGVDHEVWRTSDGGLAWEPFRAR